MMDYLGWYLRGVCALIAAFLLGYLLRSLKAKPPEHEEPWLKAAGEGNTDLADKIRRKEPGFEDPPK